MGSFFIEFRDPLFSIIVLFAILFAISFFSYWWGRYRAKDDYRYLNKFLRRFHTLPTQQELKELVHKSDLSPKAWLLLAESYRKNGDYEKAIDIYSELLQLENIELNRRDVMFLLGKTYFKAGFLGRSRDVFLEILRRNPRTPQALHYLLLVYEYMRDYNAAAEVLEPLDALNEDVSKEALYLRILALLQAPDIDETLKKQELLFLYKEHKRLHRMVLEYLFRVDPQTAWEETKNDVYPQIADILWQLRKEDISKRHIATSSFLQELYTAKGYIEDAKSSDVFELNILINLPKEVGADLAFEYVCGECKVTYPFSFNRCGSCHAIDTVTLEYNLVEKTKERYEAGNSFL